MAAASASEATPPAMASGDTGFSVADALKEMMITPSFKKFVEDNKELWLTFGTMDSAAYRKKLMKLMAAAKLNKEQRLVIHFFFAVVKKKSRVLEGMSAFDESVKQKEWYEPVRSFIAGTLTDYNTQAKSADKFPGTHVPTTNPGLDLLMWKLMSKKEHLTIENFFARTTSVQLNLNAEMQSLAQVGYKNYWDNVVKDSRNEVKSEKPQYREDYYKTSAGDTYNLVDGSLKELPPANVKTGYTRKEIENWIAAPL